MVDLRRAHNEFNYTYQTRMDPKETIICKIPLPTGNARSVKSISWYGDPNVNVYGTLASNFVSSYLKWEQLTDNAQVSPSVTAIKFENTANDYRIMHIWVVME